MLTQRQIDDILNASREADEGPTKLARRIEAAVQAAERERCIAECRAVAAEHLGQRGMYQAGREHGADECVRRLEGPNAEVTGLGRNRSNDER